MIDKRTINTLLILDIGVILFCYLAGSRIWLINSQIGFISASLVVFASMYSYRKMVEKQAEHAESCEYEDDTLEKIEDPHGLYDDVRHCEQVFESKREVLLKKDSKTNILKSLKNSRASISLYRIGAYGVLALGFLYLSSNKIFHIASYFAGITLPIVIIIILLFLQAKKGDV